ncbi:unnamed protein product [Parnassius apollo]|uniref:(apollo) hypothetical protein n=1 Tax=Parnassius apollo TaxID=110799 RepID=A0A8S3WXH4_PARAO|nr:unnamed protein product [Parnassius apollo]
MFFELLLCLFIGTTFGNVDKQNPPQWNNVYTVKGVLNIPHADVQEPFHAWYDGKNGKSRIDYYGNMVRTYQMSPSVFPKYGASFMVVPVTTETELNKDTCLHVTGTAARRIHIQSVLPDMTGFKFVGTETIQDSETSKWMLVYTTGEMVTKYTMWVKYRKGLKGGPLPIPVRYEVKGFNTLLGFERDHYYQEYSDYDVNEFDPNVFVVDRVQCAPFKGPEWSYFATFNPMKEFVHPVHDAHVGSEFDSFKTKYGRQYSSEEEHAKRLNIFRQNLRFIHSNNRARRGFSLSVNHLADRTDDELAALRGLRYSEPIPMGLPFPYGESELREMQAKLPPEFDWRLSGAVTPVKDQLWCGSCWSYGAVGAVEGALFLRNGGHLVRLSEQALIDCSWGFGNFGCGGGFPSRAYQWIMKHGLPTEVDYGSYLAQNGYCHVDNVTLVTTIKDWVDVTPNNDNALRLAIFKHGPISVGIDASQKSLHFYSQGVYFEPKCKNKPHELDHVVLAVGYGTLNGQKYWLIKNSWSNMWGNDGYVLMSSRDNNCGVETMPTYVII